jgi:hypothetical protein
MTTAGLSMRRPRSWTRSDPEGDGPGACWISAACSRLDPECPAPSRGAKAERRRWRRRRREKSRGRSGDGGAVGNCRERAQRQRNEGGGGLHEHRRTRKKKRQAPRGEKPRRGRQARGARHAA